MSKEEASDSSPQAAVESSRTFGKRWKHKELFVKGFVAVPNLFLQHYSHLKPYPLTGGEALFCLHLMEFKWDANAPFPGYAVIADRMGVSDKMARRHARNLEAKKYMRREFRVGQTNRFDLTPLFDALLKIAKQQEGKKARHRTSRQLKVAEMDAVIDWYNEMMSAYARLPKDEQVALKEWESANIGGDVSTSDWPGWTKYIGKKPGSVK